MQILDYDRVDPLDVLNLNLLSLDYALTPERVALIRQLDERPFPFFAIYAIDGGIVAGQAGVYRLPTMTSEGPEDVGGVWAVCTHPAFSRRGIAHRLLEEAHARMREAGLRFSTLGTARHRGAYRLYQQLGYEDFFVTLTTFSELESVRLATRLVAEHATPDRYPLADTFFHEVSAGYLGFARRSKAFIAMMVAIGDLGAEQVWLLWDGEELAGYALATISESVLSVNNLLLRESALAAEAVSALCQEQPVSYVRVHLDQASVGESLRKAGYPPGLPGWGTFMIKPLIPDVSVEGARRIFGVGTERFMISPIDVT